MPKTDQQKKLRRAFQMHRWNAKRRGIPFLFTFDQWVAWWMTGDRWSRRGRTKDALVMARPGDTGPYSPSNVVCISHHENRCIEPIFNMSESRKQRKRLLMKRSWANPARWDAVRRGANHPRSRPVRTQVGVFANASLAARAFEIPRQTAARMARLGLEGWCYVDRPGNVP